MKVATHRDGSELDYNEANGLFGLGDMVVTVQQVAKLDRGRKLNWTNPENREWFRRIAAVDNVKVGAPRKTNGCLLIFAIIGILFCAVTLCSMTVFGATLTAVTKQLGTPPPGVAAPVGK